MELQKEPQALQLQAVKFSIHREAAEPDLGGANPTQTVPNVSPAVRGHRCAASSDTERRSVLPVPSQRLLGAPGGLLTPFPGSSEREAPQGPFGLFSAVRAPFHGPSLLRGERLRGDGSASPERPAGRAARPCRACARAWRGGFGGRAAPGPGGLWGRR